MTLDLKAKAEKIERDYYTVNPSLYDLVKAIKDALKEVQDATRRETIELCAKLLIRKCPYFSYHCGECKACESTINAHKILALLTSPEKKEG